MFERSFFQFFQNSTTALLKKQPVLLKTGLTLGQGWDILEASSPGWSIAPAWERGIPSPDARTLPRVAAPPPLFTGKEALHVKEIRR